MHDDLKDVVSTSKIARDKLINGDLSVKDANGIAAQNHNIIGAYALDLRERVFLSETASLVNRVEALPQKFVSGEIGSPDISSN